MGLYFNKTVAGAKFREMRTHLMNCPLEYFEHEHTALNIGNMCMLMENHPTNLPLQGCVGTHTVQKIMPLARQTSTDHVVEKNDTCTGKRRSSTSIFDN